MANLMCRVTRDAIAEKNRTVRPYIVCRAGHAGIQRYAQTWAGDNSTSWESLRHNVATILGMSLSGVPNQAATSAASTGPHPSWWSHPAVPPHAGVA
ncbi:TIM-barrel domain-containing protein [Georgenia sp. SUBG003]|uniref:TIM-barrel domain-containing protein n=1 Tax=Georgenia sp. SUBG003 TaxID=1497974 RepID=UPI003AB1F4D7